MANKSWLKHISRVPCADSRLIKSIHAAWHLTHLPDIRKQVDAQHEEEQGHGKILNSAENEKKTPYYTVQCPKPGRETH